MKLRIKGNSIRLRLSRAEVATLRGGGAISDATRFPGGESLGYELCCDAGIAMLSATVAAGTLRIMLPQAAVARWAASEEVAVGADLPLAAGTLSVLVEKDFPCSSDRTCSDDEDTFAPDRLRVDR